MDPDDDNPHVIVRIIINLSSSRAYYADTAIGQIREKRYAGNLSGYADRILLAGISCDKNTRKHECIIEEK